MTTFFSIATILTILIIAILWAGFHYRKIDWGHPVMNWIDGWNRCYCRWFHGLKQPTLNLPDGPLLLISNHISGIDPFLLIAASNRPLHFIIAKEEYERPILNKLFKMSGCIPVDREGRVESAFREALKKLEKGEVVALFPHGKIHLDNYPHRPLKRGVFKLARLAQCAIQPVRIQGVTMQGSVFRSTLIPSRVQLQKFEVIQIEDVSDRESQNRLGEMLLGRKFKDGS